MRFSYNNTLNKLCEPYLLKIFERFKNLDPKEWQEDVYEVLKYVIDNIDRDNMSAYDGARTAFENYVENHDIKDIANLFDGELKRVLLFVLEEEWAEIFCNYTRLEAQYPFATGAYRRSMRDRAVNPHLRHILFALENFIIFKASGFSPDQWISQWEEYKYESLGFEDLFVVLIHQGNQKIIETFKEVFSSTKKEITFTHLRAVVKGGNSELLELESKLLLKAGLQEGLRQSIMETADEGMPHSFLHLLKTVKDNSLERFSSIKRAFGAWTGLGDVAAKNHVTIKQFESLYSFLTDKSKAREALISEDALELYLALWSIGFYDIQETVAPIEAIIREGKPHQIETVLLFINNVENSSLQASLAARIIRKFPENHKILAGAIPMYLANFFWKTPACEKEMEEKNPEKPLYDVSKYFEDEKNVVTDFEILTKLFKDLKKKEIFDPYVFPWEIKELSKDIVAGKICNIASVMHSPEWTDMILEYIPAVNPCYRDAVIIRLLTYPKSRYQIDFLIDNMGKGTVETRKEICKIVERLFEEEKLQENDFKKMENHLRLKASETRVAVIKILSGLPDTQAYETLNRLLKDKNNLKRTGGLEIVKLWNESDSRKDLISKLLPLIETIPNPDAQEKKMIAAILKNGTRKGKAIKKEERDALSYENGFGIYNPSKDAAIDIVWEPDFKADEYLIFKDPREGLELMKKLMNFIDANADLEFETAWGETERIGHSVIARYGERKKSAMNVGRPELWIHFYHKEIKTTENLLKLAMPFLIGEMDKEFEPAIKRFFGKAVTLDPYKQINDSKYYHSAKAIVEDLFYFLCDLNVVEIIVNLFTDIACRINPDDIIKKISYPGSSLDFHVWPIWLEDIYIRLNKVAEEYDFDDELFKQYFAAGYNLYQKSSLINQRYVDIRMLLRPSDFLRAWQLDMFSDEEFMKQLLGRPYSHYLINYFTRRLPGISNPLKYKGYRKDLEELPLDLTILVEKAVGTIMEIELQRGSTPTDVSHLASEIECVRGIDNFIGILVALGKDKLTKYSYNDEKSKKEVMSHLLSVCFPTDKDTAHLLRKKAREAKISDKRLIEAALYSPRWLDIVEEALDWKGLKSGAYYFLAHTGDTLDDLEKLKIGRYSKIEAQDFEDGAFDPDWFYEVYESLGEERFNVLYDAAKYVSEGNRHTRARKLSDAVLGKYTTEQLMKEISAKRNKDLVVALGLIPLKEDKEDDLLERYIFLMNFIKESKQFGAQRQTTEARAVKLSLDNLARIAGYNDSTRLTWNLETKILEGLSEFIKPSEIEGHILYILISEDAPEIILEKGGKRIKNIPPKLKNNQYVVNLKEVHRKLKDQYSRSRELLERSMCDLSDFKGKELKQLKDNPIVWSLIKKLVFINELGIPGFPTENGNELVTVDGQHIDILPEENLRIAHPYDLFKSGRWSDFQKLLFANKWTQPFKQIFRELYIATPEEKDQTKSLRYSGNQILPSKTVSILKKRQWVLDYENGLEKVLIDQNLEVVLFAMADWFTPADIEAPTLEYIAFYDRHSGNEKLIADIDPIVFSEIMRDVDLVVSVAHAGKVDPETSHSTIDMRKAIIENLIPMFGLNNVEISGKYIKVKGERGIYDIHLGSGVIHQVGGAEIAVIPVHSQSRGRIFMPFIDDDPKTAEIISKMLLFADDSKIKDPAILNQISKFK